MGAPNSISLGVPARALLVLAASIATLALPASAGAEADPGQRLYEQAARVVVSQVPGARLALPRREVADREGDESLPATPPLTDLLVGRTEVTLDPAFWSQIVYNLLASQTVVLPKPLDLVRVEVAFPTARVANGRKRWRLKREEQELALADVQYEWQGRTKNVADFVSSTETDGVAFLREGRLVGELYANGWSPEVRHQPWSVTKSFVSALVGIALDEGRVHSLADPIERYIPDLAGTAWEGTTIRNLLTMESGVHWDEGTPVLVVNTQVEQWIQMALDYYTGGALGQTRNEFLAALPRVAPQGTQFSYNSGNTQLLAWMLENLYEQPFNEIISRKLWRPMGMATDAMVMTDRVGDAIASQGLYSRIYDLGRFGELFRLGGRTAGGRQVIPAAWVRRSTAMTPNSDRSYAFQWWAGPAPHSYEASGFQGQKITVSPQRCLVGVRLSHTLGGDLTPGSDDPLDPGGYGFEVEMGGAEWWAAYQAVAEHLGPCDQALKLRLRRSRAIDRRRALREGVVPVRAASGSQLAEVAFTVTARRGSHRVHVGGGRVTLAPGAAQTAAVPLSRRGRAVLRRQRPASLIVTARARDADGQRQRARGSLRLR